jgi:hypothetical protein
VRYKSRVEGERQTTTAAAPAVSVLRWPSGRARGGVFEMFSAKETGWFDMPEPEALDATQGENLLLVSASRSATPGQPAVLLSFVNTSPGEAVKLSLKLAGPAATAVTGTIVTAPPMLSGHAGRGRSPDVLPTEPPAPFHGAVVRGKVVEITVPARSVVILTVRQEEPAALRPVPATSRLTM